MTCVVGLIDNGAVHMGADSLGVAGLDKAARLNPKVFLRDGYLIGFTTSYRMGQILQYEAELPDPRRVKSKDLMRFMVVEFVEAARDAMKGGGYIKIDSNQEEGGHFLVGANGRLFHVEADFQVGEALFPFDSVGCGFSYALGSMLTSSGDPRQRVLDALKAAETFSAGVGGPMNVLSLPAR